MAKLSFGQVDRFRGDVIIDGELTVSNSIVPVEYVNIISSSQLLSGDSILIVNDSITEIERISAELVFGTTAYTLNSSDTILVKTLSGSDTVRIAGIEASFLELTEDKITGSPVSTQKSDGKIYWIDIPSGLFTLGDSGLIIYTKVKRRN